MNLTQLEPSSAYPIAGRDRMAAIETGVLADEAVVFGTATAVTNCDINLVTQLAAPAAPTVVATGTTGSTSYTYLVADIGNVGVSPSTATTNTTGNASLSTTNYNAVTFIGISGHTYGVYRSAGGTTQGLIATVTLTPTTTYPAGSSVSSVVNDTGLAATYGTPTANTTACVLQVGPALESYGVQVVSNSAAASLSVANITNNILVRTGGAALTDTFPTAATLVANFPGAKVNSGFALVYRNGNSGSITLSCTTGGTLATGNTNTVISLNARMIFFQFTNVTAGSEAFTVYTGPTSAY